MQTIIDTFFSRKKIKIEVGGETKVVFKAKGGQDIYLDEEGQFILGRWKPKSEPEATPLQRVRDPWPAKLKSFVVNRRGLASAWRSRQLAMSGAWKKLIPDLEKLKTLFEEEIRTNVVRNGKLSPKIKARLWKAGYLFLKTQKPELREARIKILFLFRDLQGNINIGAALARTVAIADRLRERLEGIYGWLAVYSGQASFLNAIQKRLDKSFDKIEHELKVMQKHSFFTGQILPESQSEPLLNKIRILKREMENLQPFQPYREWAQMTQFDLNAISGSVKLRKFNEGLNFLRTILVYFQIKRQQRLMDKFLLELGKGQILNQWKSVFDHWLERLIISFKQLQPEEEEMKSQKPVCEKIISLLLEAKAIGREGGSIANFAAPLKKAYLLL